MAYGGEEKFTNSLAKWLVGHSHEVTVIGRGFACIKSRRVPAKGEQATEPIGTANYRTISIPYSLYFLYEIVLTILWTLRIISIHIQHPLTLVHAQDTGYAGLAAVISGKLLRIPVVISSHGIRHNTLQSIIVGRLKKAFLNIEYNLDVYTVRNGSSIIAVNEYIKDYFEKITNRHVHVLPIPIKISNFEFSQINRDLMRKEFGLYNQSRVIGFVGRFSPEKNILTLLKAFVNVARREPLSKLVLIGAGPDEARIKDFVDKSGVQEKIVFGRARPDIGKILSGVDIFVLPSYTEGLSTALLEAMASGRAIICSDIPGNRELVIPNQEALIVDPRDPDKLEKAIELLLTDGSLRSKLGNAAKIKASKYDETVIFPEIIRFYDLLFSEGATKNCGHHSPGTIY